MSKNSVLQVFFKKILNRQQPRLHLKQEILFNKTRSIFMGWKFDLFPSQVLKRLMAYCVCVLSARAVGGEPGRLRPDV